MGYCSSTRVTVAHQKIPEDTKSYTAIPMGSLGDTLVAQGYQESHQEMQQ